MFQFTTTNVINSNKDLSTGKALWTVQKAAEGKSASVHVKRVNNFVADNVVALYKAEAVEAELAKVTFDLSMLNAFKGDQMRLSIYVGLTLASLDSRYANDFIYKGKPFNIDFVFLGDAATTAEYLDKIIKKYELMVFGEKLLNVSHSGNYISIEATTEYQRFRKVNFEQFDAHAHNEMGEYLVERSLEDLPVAKSNAQVSASAEGFFSGKEGFGTYSFILHNLRIPTFARTRAFGINQEENPIIGAKYNQYTLHYCVNRGILGSNAVGDIVKSMTTHVFFVNQDIAAEFEEALANLGTILTVAPGEKTPDPTSVVEDLATMAKKIEKLEKAIAAKQDKLVAGDGIEVDGKDVKVKLDQDTLSASTKGLKVTDGKFQPAK